VGEGSVLDIRPVACPGRFFGSNIRRSIKRRLTSILSDLAFCLALDGPMIAAFIVAGIIAGPLGKAGRNDLTLVPTFNKSPNCLCDTSIRSRGRRVKKCRGIHRSRCPRWTIHWSVKRHVIRWERRLSLKKTGAIARSRQNKLHERTRGWTGVGY
jgi:hypothetical protein